MNNPAQKQAIEMIKSFPEATSFALIMMNESLDVKFISSGTSRDQVYLNHTLGAMLANKTAEGVKVKTEKATSLVAVPPEGDQK